MSAPTTPTKSSAEPTTSSSRKAISWYTWDDYSRDGISLTKHPGSRNVVIPHHIYQYTYKEDISIERARQYLNLPQEAFIVTAFGKFRNREEIRMVASAFCKWNEKNKLLLAPRLYPFSRRNEYGWNLFKRWASRLGYYLAMPLLNRLLKFHAGANDELIDNCDLPYYIAASDVIFIQRKDILNSGNVPLGFLFHKVVVGPDRQETSEKYYPQPEIRRSIRTTRSDILRGTRREHVNLSAWGQGEKNYAYAYGKYEHPQNRTRNMHKPIKM